MSKAKKVAKKETDAGEMVNLPSNVTDLVSSPENPRRMTDEAQTALGCSMERFGDISGLVFNLRSGRQVCGHQRKTHLPADAQVEDFTPEHDDAGTVGYGYVRAHGTRWRVRFVEWDEVTERAANLAANSETLTGFWTRDLTDNLEFLESLRPDLAADLDLNSIPALGFFEKPEDNEPIDESTLIKSGNTCPKCGFRY